MKSNLHQRISFKYTGSPQSVSLKPGKYLFEAWGSSGFKSLCGQSFIPRGRGAYTKGMLELNSSRTFYVFVGSQGILSKETFNSNRPGNAACNGGGATDFRLTSGEWDEFESTRSRIMVAAGGGGTDCSSGGDGGALEGLKGDWQSTFIIPTAGNQTNGGLAGISSIGTGFPGGFGFGGSGKSSNPKISDDGAGSGGGGYYGGGGININGGGAGGSSFISGHPDCDAITLESTEKFIVHSHQPVHYSGLQFYLTEMIAGNSSMPSPTGKPEIGHSGNGFASILFLDALPISCKLNKYSFHISYFCLIILFQSE